MLISYKKTNRMYPVFAEHKVAIATISLGMHASHSLDKKIKSAAAHGFDGIEMVHWDLVAYAESHSIPVIKAGQIMRELCIEQNIAVLSLQPFMNFEDSATPLDERLELAREWVKLARILGTNIIQVPTSFDTDSTGDEKTIVRELQDLSDVGLEGGPPVLFA